MPPHGHQVKPFFKGFASLNLPPCYTRSNRGPTDVLQLLGQSTKANPLSCRWAWLRRQGQKYLYNLEGPRARERPVQAV